MSIGRQIERAALRTLPASSRIHLRAVYMSARGVVEPEAYVAAAAMSGGRAIDVGANHGCYTRLLARTSDAVEAFEPQPFCAETIAAAGLPNVTLHREGLSAEAGELELHVPMKDGVALTGCASFGPVEGEYETIPVPVRRLDDHGFTDVRFIKIDTEGHEMAVLRGGRRTIDRDRPVLLVEIMQCHLPDTTVEAEISEIEAMGYLTTIMSRSGVVPLAADIERATLNYAENYLFIPMDRPELLPRLDAIAKRVLARPAVAFASRRA